MQTNAAERLLGNLADLVDLPPYDESKRVLLSRTFAITSLHFAAAVRRLCESHLPLGAAAVLRSQFEALLRCVWALYRASEVQVERLSSDLSLDSQQATKNFPLAAEMLDELGKAPQVANLLIALREFKDSSWGPLNSFVHSGIHAVHWTRFEPPHALVDQMFRSSNGLAVLAFQSLAILTGRNGLQAEIYSTCASFSTCLPPSRAP